MSNRHGINYIYIFSVLTLVSIFAALIAIQIWKDSLIGGIIFTVFYSGALINGVMQLFVQKRIKRVDITSEAIIIEFRARSVEIRFEECKRIEHYKHGPLTEKVLAYVKNNVYEIPFDLRKFHELCKSIYVGLTKNNMGNIADEWFQKKYAADIRLNQTEK